MHAPQIIYIVLTGIGLGIALAKNGEPRSPHNFGALFVRELLVSGLLYWGGFFTN